MAWLKNPFARKPITKKRTRRQRVRLAVEPLEERVLLFGPATISWDGGGGDLQWFNELNWTEDRLPHDLDNVDLRVAGDPVTIVLPEEVTVINSLFSEENLDLGGGLTIKADAEILGAIHNGSLTVEENGAVILRGGGTFSPQFSGASVLFPTGAYTLNTQFLEGGAGVGILYGSVYVGPAATVIVDAGQYQLTDVNLTGRALEFIGDANVDVSGDVIAQNLRLAHEHVDLFGAGLTVTGTFDWVAGTVALMDEFTLTSTATLQLNGTRDRYLVGISFNNEGRVTHEPDGTGPIRRATDFGSELLVNQYIPPPPGPAAFKPIADGAALFRAMYGGLTGAGTTEEAIWAILEGKTLEQINTIRDAYQAHYQRDLGADLDSELNDNDDERERAAALLAGERPAADAAGLHHAMAYPTTNEPDVYKILAGKTAAELAAIKTAYVQRYGQTLEDAIFDEFFGSELDRALALLNGNPAKADAAELYYAMHGGTGLGTTEETVYRVLTKYVGGLTWMLEQEYFGLYQQELLDDLDSEFSGAERDRALALYHGDLMTAAAARLKAAMSGLGTAEKEVWDTLENLTSEKRAVIANIFRHLYGEELSAAITDEFSNTELYGEELNKTRDLFHQGGLSDPQRLHYAFSGLGTDEVEVREVMDRVLQLEGDDLNAFKTAFQDRSGVEVRDALESELSGRDEFVALQNLRGKPQSLQEELDRLKELRQYERTTYVGLINPFAPAVLDALVSDGPRVDQSVAAADAFLLAAVADGTVTPAEEAEFRRLMAIAREDVTSYQDFKDAAADAFGNALSTVAGIAVMWATAGAGTPISLWLVGLYAGTAAAAGQVIGQVTVSGLSYDMEAMPEHIVTGFVNGATMPISFAGLPNANTPFGRFFQGAWAGMREGSLSGFTAGVAGTMIRDGVWDDGFWEGMARVGEGGFMGFVNGGLTGGLFGAFLGNFLHQCFPAGTLVATDTGLKSIETIKANQKVWAYNFRTGDWSLCAVVRPLEHDYDGDLITLEVAGESIEATGNHPFWVIEGDGLAHRATPEYVPAEEPNNPTTPGRWVDARDLRVGDVLLRHGNKPARVTSVAARWERLRVYNLHVAELHTFAVGAGQVLVHNRANGPWPPTAPVGPKPAYDAVDAAQWRYERYVWDGYQAGRTRESLLGFAEYHQQYFLPSAKGLRTGRKGSPAHQADVNRNNVAPNNLVARRYPGGLTPDGVGEPGQAVIIRGQTIAPEGNGRVIVESDPTVYHGEMPHSEAREQIRRYRAADPEATIVVTDPNRPDLPPLIYRPGEQPPPEGRLAPGTPAVVPYP